MQIVADPKVLLIIYELQSQLRNETACAFLGAGTSVNLSIPTWHNLLIELDEKLNTQIIKDQHFENPYEVASSIYKRLNNKNEFYNVLFEIIYKTSTNFTGFHIEIINTFNLILTTNYNLSLANAFQSLSNSLIRMSQRQKIALKEIKHPNLEYSKVNGEEKYLVYLHGKAELPPRIIFTSEEYKKYYKSHEKLDGKFDTSLQKFLHNTISNKSIVFIGFGFVLNA